MLCAVCLEKSRAILKLFFVSVLALTLCSPVLADNENGDDEGNNSKIIMCQLKENGIYKKKKTLEKQAHRKQQKGWLFPGDVIPNMPNHVLNDECESVVVEPDPDDNANCAIGEICLMLNATEVTGEEIRLMLYDTSEEAWPQQFFSLPTPTAVVSQTVPLPDSFPLSIRIPLVDNLFAFSGELPEGTRLGLAVATGVSSTFIVSPTDARGFSEGSLIYDLSQPMDYGSVEMRVPAGDVCELNPFNPSCLTGSIFWEPRFLGQEQFVPGAIYMHMADLNGDGVKDLVTVGEPHFEVPQLPLTALKLGVYYLNSDLTVQSQEIIDSWSEQDPVFYSPWGVRVIEHAGAPMIIVGTNIPELAPLEDGSGAVLSYRKVQNQWSRDVIRANPLPTEVNYNAMIVVTCDIDNDGDDDLALSGAFGSSAVGSWLENTGNFEIPWVEHLTEQAPDTDPFIRGTLAYKCADLNNDSYPEVVYNAMFDIPNTQPQQFRGEIWLAVNPGPDGWGERWPKQVVDDDNWASADMWFHDFDRDTYPDLVANQIFNSTVTRYRNPEGDLFANWGAEVIVSGLTSPSDFWLADMDKDGEMDIVSADHTAHRGVWHRNPGYGSNAPWEFRSIFRDIRLPGDFEMQDHDGDGDLDWMGISLTLGQAYIVEQVEPPASLVATITVPDDFTVPVTRLIVTLASQLPVTGIPAATLVTIENVDNDEDGQLDVDQILNKDRDLVLPIKDVGVSGDFHVVVGLYVEGGGDFAPVPGIDYQGASGKLTFGQGKVETQIDLTNTLGP